MAEINTVIAEASQDLQTIEDFVNLPADSEVYPRLLPSVNVGTLAGARQAIFEAGGLPAKPFTTKALMTASALIDGDYAMVIDDTVNNGLYVKTAGVWVKSSYDPTALANTYTDNKVKGVTNNFKTKALMTASTLANDSYAMVTEDTEANNGRYSKVAGAWVKSEYDPFAQSKAHTDESIREVMEHDSNDGHIAVLVDSDNKKVASVNLDGEFDLRLTKDSIEAINYIKKDSNENDFLVLLDDSGKVVFKIDENTQALNNHISVDDNRDYAVVVLDSANKVLSTYPNDSKQVSSSASNTLYPYPLKHERASVTIKSLTLLEDKMAINTVAVGRTGSPEVIVNGDGLTHPKMIYVAGGWNGYCYWLAATPTFGVVVGAEYENPHVFASNDLKNWVEPSGAPIDLPEDGNGSYWSDTHLAVGDDGYLYCWYRGNGFNFTNYGRLVCYKRSRDGVNWSDRVEVYGTDDGEFGVDSSNLIASPAFHRDGAKWVCYDVVRSSATGGMLIDNAPAHIKTHVFRRTGGDVTSNFGKYDNTQQMVNYSPILWGEENDPWHIDSIKVGNLYLHLLATGLDDVSKSRDLYLAWSSDGWNFRVLPKLDTGGADDYRSSLTVTKVTEDVIDIKLVNAKTNGVLKLYNLTLGVS